jgi:glycosyltransferase involved in cell wall biosynthesis
MNKKRLKVTLLTNSFTGGGAERASNTLVNAMFDLQIKTSIIAVNAGPADLIKPLCEKYCLERPWKGGAGATVKAYLQLSRLIFRIKPNFLIINCDLPELLAAFLFTSSKLIVVEHSSGPWPDRRNLGVFVRKLLKFRNAQFVAVSSHLQIWPGKNKPAAVFNNAILSSNRLVSGAKQTNTQLRRLVFIGRLSKEKNPQYLIDISEKTNIPCAFFGDGIMREDLRHLSMKQLVQVDFFGHVTNPWEYINENDLLIIPSEFEGDGLVLVEGLFNNVPMLVRKIDDLLRFGLPSKNYCNSTEGFISRVNEVSTNIASLRIPESIAGKILEGRKPQVIAQQWMDYLKSF